MSELPKKRSRQVLPEDKYAAGLRRVVERNYFPTLSKHRLLKKYLEAQETQDPKAEAAAAEALDASEPTPGPTLSQFMQQYKSEDNQSYEAIQEKHRALLQKKHKQSERLSELVFIPPALPAPPRPPHAGIDWANLTTQQATSGFFVCAI